MRFFGKRVATSGLATASSVPLAKAKTKVSQVEEHVGGLLGLAFAGTKGDERRKNVEEEGREDQLAVADLVHHHAADDDAEAESGESGTADGSQLRAGETEVGRPVGKDAATDTEADTGC